MLRGPRANVGPTIAERATSAYLTDHLAASTYNCDLARRFAVWLAGTERGARLAELASELEADRQALTEIMGRLRIRRDPAKQATTWVEAKANRLRRSGFGAGDEPTGLLLALEDLVRGTEGTACLWRTLRDVSDHQPALDPRELDRLVTRAEDQQRRLEAERRMAGVQALLEGPGAP